MIIVTLLGVSILGETLNLGSILGGILIAIGLYLVVWGKGRDYFGSEDLPVSTDEKSSIQYVSTTQNEAVTNLNSNNNGDNP
jgi:drug/metabolite transporter (DMT)-like permease